MVVKQSEITLFLTAATRILHQNAIIFAFQTYMSADKDAELAFTDEDEGSHVDQELIKGAVNQSPYQTNVLCLVCKDDSTCFLSHQNVC